MPIPRMESAIGLNGFALSREQERFDSGEAVAVGDVNEKRPTSMASMPTRLTSVRVRNILGV